MMKGGGFRFVALLAAVCTAGALLQAMMRGHARAQAIGASTGQTSVGVAPEEQLSLQNPKRNLTATSSPSSATVPATSTASSGFHSAGSWTIPLSYPSAASSRPVVIPGGDAPFALSPPRKVAPFPIVLNRAVERYVNEYLRNPAGLRARLLAVHPFLHEMASILASYGVPKDFICLAFAESAFSSDNGGPWQLTKATARSFGLRVNRWIDERLDPVKSTRAAAEYLTFLHDFVGNWLLTIVAWNTGENSNLPFEELKNADYAELYEHLPRRTRLLLERFMALDFITSHPSMLGLDISVFTDDEAARPPHALITVPPATSLREAAKMAHTTVSMLRMLNPALLQDRVPPDTSYTLRVPAKVADSFSSSSNSKPF